MYAVSFNMVADNLAFQYDTTRLKNSRLAARFYTKTSLP